MINKIFLCLALGNLSNTEFKMKKDSLKTACQYSHQIIEESKTKQISPFLLTSLIWVESRFEKSAISPKSACGLTQVLHKYSKYSCKELQQPIISIKEGLRALNFWISSKKNTKKALECYNSGYYCNSPFYAKQIINKTQKLKAEYEKVLYHFDGGQKNE